MEEISCLISLGSNTESDKYLETARKELLSHFPDITFAKACHTRPIKLKNPSLFVNQVALFHTFLTQREVKHILNAIEFKCAETPKDKAAEIIRMDIDLLQYGTNVLKPEDMKFSYIQSGIKMLVR